jgi:hypothetical protein
VHPLTISRWERGAVQPDGTAVRLLTLLDREARVPVSAQQIDPVLKALAAGAAVAGFTILLRSVLSRR